MALVPQALLPQQKAQNHFPNLNVHFQSFPKIQNITRRLSISLFFPALLLPKQSAFDVQPANAFDFRMAVPDQTAEEAEAAINGHAESLLQVKGMFESPTDTWKDARKALRKRASYLKQDIYTLIQSKPGSERPVLRKLYSKLFNSVSAMDFAARDEDVTRVWDCYGGIVSSLNEILARI